MATRWMREFRKANDERLRQLNKRYSGDPSYDAAAYEAAKAEIDVLKRPQVEAEESHHQRVMEQLDELMQRYEAILAEANRLLGSE